MCLMDLLSVNLLNIILPGVVSVVVSAVVSYLLGPLMVVRQEAAKGDAHVRTELRRILGGIVLLLEHEVANRENVMKGISVPENKFLKPWHFDEPFWRLIRTAEDPRLYRRNRERLYKDLQGIIPRRFEILRKLPQAPPREPEDQELDPWNPLYAALLNAQKESDFVRALRPPRGDESALAEMRQVIARLRRMEKLLEK
jgi:hypothetical protein